MRILLELKRDFESALLSQVLKLFQSSCMHVFNVAKGSQHLKGPSIERLVLKDRTQSLYLMSQIRPVLHQLLLEKKINEIAEGVESGSSGHHDDSSRLGIGQL